MMEQKASDMTWEKNLSEDLFAEESPEEQARIDALVAHDSADDVVKLGKLEDLEKLETAPVGVEKKTATSEPATDDLLIDKNKLLMFKKIADSIKDSATQLSSLLGAVVDDQRAGPSFIVGERAITKEAVAEAGVIVEGIFDGEKMIGADGKAYDVPANYASKSRLVEGDGLKLVISGSGAYIFKQIKPIERRRLVGVLEQAPTGEFAVLSGERRWRVLDASVSYFKGDAGDEAVIMVPRVGAARWAAVENIIKK